MRDHQSRRLRFAFDGAIINHGATKAGGIGFDMRLAMAVPDMWIKLLKVRALAREIVFASLLVVGPFVHSFFDR
jgi:hypothetical protein